jgi:dUTP pyrophosphatase
MSSYYENLQQYNMTTINTVLTSSAFKPQYADIGSSGSDLFACIEKSISLESLERVCIPTGVKIIIPPGLEVQIRPRSGLAIKNGITILNTPGTIDSSYRGEIKVIIINLSKNTFIIEPGMKIAQAICTSIIKMNFYLVSELEFNQNNSTRGSKGFGSTGNTALNN